MINITHENTMKLLVENANTQMDDYVWAMLDTLEDFERTNEILQAENREMRQTIETLKQVINLLTHQHKDKGE